MQVKRKRYRIDDILFDFRRVINSRTRINQEKINFGRGSCTLLLAHNVLMPTFYSGNSLPHMRGLRGNHSGIRAIELSSHNIKKGGSSSVHYRH